MSLLKRNSPVVIARLLPGFFRSLSWLAKEGLPLTGPLSIEQEKSLGLPRGWGGAGGWAGLCALLIEARNGENFLGSAEVRLFVETKIHRRAAPLAAPERFVSFLQTIGAEIDTGVGTIWKDSIHSRRLHKMKSIVRGRRIVFVGPPRTWTFADSLGVDPADFIVIPETDAFVLHDEIYDLLLQRLKQSDPWLPLVMHSASIAGNVLMCRLAKAGHRFIGLDIGLAASLFDIEYLATRPWFAARRRSFIYEQRALTGDVLSARFIKQLLLVGRATSQITRWPNILETVQDNPEAAVRGLRDLVNSCEPLFPLPVLRGTLLIWDFFFRGTVESALLAACEGETSRAEPLLAAIAVLDLCREQDRASHLLSRVERLNPRDFRVPLWREMTLSAETTFEERKSLWANLLTSDGRPDLGSELSWSIYGDVKRVEPSRF